MALNIEEKMMELVAGLARVEQKLDSHIQTEDAWRSALDQKFTVQTSIRVGWWQTILVAVASSGIITGLIAIIRR